jgi:histidinol dehydrogenase
MAVGGAASARSLADVLPRALRHARIAVVDSADEALHLLDSVTPELLVVLEGKAHGELRAIAAMRDIPVLVRAKP